jgi:sec-independent protein translocase protein TatA
MIGLTSPTHLALLLLIALLLFGAKRVPEIGRSLGSGMREFKESISHETVALPETTTEQKTVEHVD